MHFLFSSPMTLFSFILFSFSAFLIFHTSFSAFLAPVIQDKSYRFFTLSVYLKNPPQPTNLLLDISSPLSWVTNCSHNNYHLIPCSSSLCTGLGGCTRNSCVISSTGKNLMPVATADSFALQITDGRNPGRLAVIPEFVFSCSEKNVGPNGMAGLAALGRSNFSLSAQVSRPGLTSAHVFALCLSGSPSAPGVAFFGTRGPYYFLPQVDLSKFLVYTPLLSNRGASTRRSAEYFIGLTGIRINDKPVPLNQTLMNRKDHGGARLNTVIPYTMLHSNIYQAFVEAFVNESAVLNLTVTQPVKPFDVCYNADDIVETNVGPDVPVVDLVMQNDDVRWRILGSNSMVRISREGLDMWCLGFVDGGTKLRPLIMVGGHQMVDNLLQFDVENNQLGFTSSVLVHNTMCANFNFTQNNTLLY